MKLLVAFLCLLALGCAAATASGDGIVPAEGPWHGTTSAGLPVAFEVHTGQVTGIRFRFKWGFCGTYEATPSGPSPIAPNGSWKGEDSRGQIIEATFVAPDRAEGKVTALSRELPGCPETHASFVAEPGAAVFEEAESVVLADVRKRKLVHEPTHLVLKANGAFRFDGLRWQGFGEPVAHASGRASIRCLRCRHRALWRPRVGVWLNALTPQGDYRVYLHVHYVLQGAVPPGFRHQGGRFLE
jgi:DNA-directed RNA polymerase subunit RPC12/RpoP